jgi:hypothetical protein
MFAESKTRMGRIVLNWLTATFAVDAPSAAA